MIKKVIFISGLGGTGKSSVVHYFLENPIKGFTFFDFDKGKYKAPPYDKPHLHGEWRVKQNRWWLSVANKEYEKNKDIPVVVGLSRYPRQLLSFPEAKEFNQENIHFGLLTCNDDARKERLHGRGDPHHWQGKKDWYDEFFHEMELVNAHVIDTSKLTIEEVAQDIKEWLATIAK